MLQEFNELEYYAPIPGSDPVEYRYNAWGYSTVGFFAPMSRYSANIAAGGPPRSLAHEFKSLVKEAHKRGIEVRRWGSVGGAREAAPFLSRKLWVREASRARLSGVRGDV